MVTWCLMQWGCDSVQALQEDGVKVMTINPAQVSTPMTWSRPDSEYISDLMIQPQEIADLCVFAFKVNAAHACLTAPNACLILSSGAHYNPIRS